MKTKLLSLTFIIIAVVLSFIAYYSTLPRQKYLTNTTELYSLFTPYMKSHVNSYLQTIECQPTKYYYENSSICFACKGMDACFGYGWVNRSGGERMNPKGMPYLKNVKEFSPKVADFYYDDLASKFNCKVKDSKTLKCEKEVTFVMENSDVKFLLSNPDKFSDVAQAICSHFGNGNANCTDSFCTCRDMNIILIRGVVRYAYSI